MLRPPKSACLFEQKLAKIFRKGDISNWNSLDEISWRNNCDIYIIIYIYMYIYVYIYLDILNFCAKWIKTAVYQIWSCVAIQPTFWGLNYASVFMKLSTFVASILILVKLLCSLVFICLACSSSSPYSCQWPVIGKHLSVWALWQPKLGYQWSRTFWHAFTVKPVLGWM